MQKEDIRKAEEKDIWEISQLIQNTVKEVNSKDISKEQVQAWVNHHSVSYVTDFIKTMDFFCLVESNRIIGVAWLKRNFLKGLYVSSNELSKGYGTKLMEFVEEYAKSKRYTKLALNSSKTALQFYRKRGYIFKRMAYSKILGVNFQEFRMEKDL